MSVVLNAAYTSNMVDAVTFNVLTLMGQGHRMYLGMTSLRQVWFEYFLVGVNIYSSDL